MVEEGTTPVGDAADGAGSTQPRVVKKVVKKTVVRPTAPGAAARAPRPTAPKASAVSRLKAKDVKRGPEPRSDRGTDSVVETRTPDPSAGPSTVDTAPPKQSGPRTTIDLGAALGSVTDRVRDVVGDGTELARRLGFAVRDRGEDAVWAVRDYRVPTIPPLRASLVTGLLAGLIITAGGWGCLNLFSALRGTSSGGALWGGLAVLLVVAIAYEVGARLLRAFGVWQARAVLALSVMVVAVVVMLLFLQPVDGPWAWLIVPGLMTATVPLVQRFLVWAADDEPQHDAGR